ncbi:hypothetical protein [Kineosporia sp. NBRC 101731]|uniref:hypothetical protein n=1 Tax=Kineosporia sp. NBRC 101731 TaxID=3032199 RepID=UPI0025530704|nr:hypothetical protein [Kineosporia sp. NBRC 101731]
MSRALNDYAPRAGYDEQWLGQSRYVLFRDRLDRVFGCVDYVVGPGDEHLGRDELYAELTDGDITSMPSLAAGTVQRKDLNSSPGWVYGDWRLLLTSGDFGRLQRIPWAQKSPTKQAVARQSGRTDPQQGVLFDAAELLNHPEPTVDLDLHTFVIAHALHPVTHQTELAIGLPRRSDRGGGSWHWLRYLKTRPHGAEDWNDGIAPPSGPAVPVTDPVVKRRTHGAERANDRASDER